MVVSMGLPGEGGAMVAEPTGVESTATASANMSMGGAFDGKDDGDGGKKPEKWKGVLAEFHLHVLRSYAPIYIYTYRFLYINNIYRYTYIYIYTYISMTWIGAMLLYIYTHFYACI